MINTNSTIQVNMQRQNTVQAMCNNAAFIRYIVDLQNEELWEGVGPDFGPSPLPQCIILRTTIYLFVYNFLLHISFRLYTLTVVHYIMCNKHIQILLIGYVLYRFHITQYRMWLLQHVGVAVRVRCSYSNRSYQLNVVVTDDPQHTFQLAVATTVLRACCAIWDLRSRLEESGCEEMVTYDGIHFLWFLTKIPFDDTYSLHRIVSTLILRSP